MSQKSKAVKPHWAVNAVQRLRALHGLPAHFSPDDAIRAGLCTEDDWLDALDTERELFWSGNGIQARTNVTERRPVAVENVEYPPELEELMWAGLPSGQPTRPRRQKRKSLGLDFRKAVLEAFSAQDEPAA